MNVELPEALRFHMWLLAQAESNALEGQHETAERLRALDALVLDHPAEFEAYMRVRHLHRREQHG